MNWVAFALLFLLFGCSQPSLVPMPGLTPALTKDSTPALSAANNGETQKAGSTLATANAGELHHILNANVLTREDAVQRSKQISQVSYTLWFGLSDDQTQFEGRTVVRFNFKNKSRDTFKRIALDFEGGSVHSIQCNGATLTDLSQPDRFDGHRIYFSTNELRPKSNQIEIAYSHPYSSNGEGLHRFIDPIDKKVYLYTQFEPYHAHQLFPCFDQPDLKATYELSVEAPQSWTVISNTLEREITPVDGRRSWSFPATKPLSTYLFALHAGPYASWKANANGIPLRLFSRKSLVSYIDSKEWLEITVKGLQFYH
jgi:aminopeptidase N